MKKIIEYRSITLHGSEIHVLGEKVNEKIREGFQPYGFPCVSGATSFDKSDFVLVQAMVKYEE